MHHTYTHSQCKQIRVLFIWLNIQATEETASSDMITLHSTGSGAYRSWDNREHSGGRKPLFNSQPCSAQVKKKKEKIKSAHRSTQRKTTSELQLQSDICSYTNPLTRQLTLGQGWALMQRRLWRVAFGGLSFWSLMCTFEVCFVHVVLAATAGKFYVSINTPHWECRTHYPDVNLTKRKGRGRD